MNSNSLSASTSYLNSFTDPGKDGYTGNTDQNVGIDAAGFSLHYYTGDYIPIGSEISTPTITASNSPIASIAGSDILGARNDLWNGNVSAMVTTLRDPNNTTNILPLGMAYKYDQLNMLVNAQGYINMGTDPTNSGSYSFNQWAPGSGSLDAYNGAYLNTFAYYPNGNIEHQQDITPLALAAIPIPAALILMVRLMTLIINT